MINLVAGRIQTQVQNGVESEYVSSFFQFKIPHIITKRNTWEQGTNSGIFSESEFDLDYNNMANSGVDGQGTNIIQVYRSAFGLTDDNNDLSSLVGTKLNFFGSANITDKLPFELWVANVNNNNKSVELRFGIKENSIYMKILVRNMTKQSFGFQLYWLCSNDTYNGDSIDSLLSTSKSTEQTLFSNNSHLKTMNVPPYAPLSCYYTTRDYTSDTVVMGGMRFDEWYSTPSGIGAQGSLMPNLSRWSNWYRMLKGSPFYGTPYTFEIPEEYQTSNGIKKIEFGIMTSQRRLDDGGDDMTDTFNNSSSDMSMYNGSHTGQAYSYFCTGTNLCEFFDLTNNSTQQQYFAGGYIERKIVGSYRVQYSIKNANGILATFCDSKNIVESLSNATQYWTDRNDRRYGGVYLFVNNDFTSIPGASWIREIPDNISHWTAQDCPLYFATLTVNNYMSFSYIDRDTMDWTDRDCVGMVENVVNNNKSFYYLMDQTSSMTKDFWVDLLNGFADGEDINIGGGSIGGGTSTSGGGHGAFNDSSATINGISDLITTSPTSMMGNGVSPALINAYKVSTGAMNEFIDKCWDTSWDITDITKSFGNSVDPMSAIIACKFCPFEVPASSGGTLAIEIGGKTIFLEHHNVNTLTSEITHLQFGSVDLEEYFGSYVDYDETKISIVLPYVGIQEINARECMGGTITLDAYADIMDGSITYFLTLYKNNITNLINTWRGVACWDLPLTGRDMHEKNTAMMGAITGTVSSTAMGAVNGFLLGGGHGAALGAGIAAASGVASGVANYLSSRPSMTRSGSFGGDRCSITKAYLIIERPKISLPETYAHEYGYPSNISTKMKYLTGYTVVAETHLTNMGRATQEEVQEIETLLKSGVIF